MLSRRQFVRISSLAGAAALLAACGQPVPPTAPATTAPAPQKPAEPATKPTAATASAPTAAPAASGNLPQVILDPAKLPKQFKDLLGQQGGQPGVNKGPRR
jgi:anaerobic selenocysteine-containing dehydrogenase